MRIDRATAGIIYRRKHQNSIHTFRAYGVFKIRGLSLKRQIIAKDASTPSNQIPCDWAVGHQPVSSLGLSGKTEWRHHCVSATGFPMIALLKHDGRDASSWGCRLLRGGLASQTFYYSSLTSFQGRRIFFFFWEKIPLCGRRQPPSEPRIKGMC